MSRYLCWANVSSLVLLVALSFAACTHNPSETCTLNLTIAPNPMAGRVEITPEKLFYDPGTIIQLHARASSGWEFTGWTGITPANANPVTIQCFSDSTITATFRAIPSDPDSEGEMPIEGEEAPVFEGELEFEGEEPRATEGENESISCTKTYPWEWELGSEPTVHAEQIIAWEDEVYQQINAIRRQYSLAEFFRDTCIARVARGHSRDMAENGYFAHINLEEENHGDRLRDGNVQWIASAENLAYYPLSDGDPISPCVNAWMKSPSHRENILAPRYTHTGIGIAIDAAGGLYITQNFVKY